jgi:hypothetical protein
MVSHRSPVITPGFAMVHPEAMHKIIGMYAHIFVRDSASRFDASRYLCSNDDRPAPGATTSQGLPAVFSWIHKTGFENASMGTQHERFRQSDDSSG